LAVKQLFFTISLGYSILLLWSVATLGNTLGAVVNYWLGLKGERFLEKKGYLSSIKTKKAHQRFEK